MERIRKLLMKWEHFDNDTDFFKHNIRTYEIIGNFLLIYLIIFNIVSTGFSIWNYSKWYQAYAALCILSMEIKRN